MKNRNIKTRFLALLTVIVLLFSLAGCSTSYEWHGIDEYIHGEDDNFYGNSEVEIDHFSLYGTSFFEDYPYIDGGYHYEENAVLYFFDVCETAVLYFEYEDEVYEEVKAFCFETFEEMGENPSESYGDFEFYDFYENRDKSEYYHGDDYPNSFKRVAFNDEENKLVFLGFHTSVGKPREKVAEDINDWGAFLKEYYGNYYLFD